MMDADVWARFMAKDYDGVLNIVGNTLSTSQTFGYIHVAGLSLLALGRVDEGMDWLCASLALTVAPEGWFANGAIACMEQRQYLRALLFLDNGLKEHPGHLHMTYMQGICRVNVHEWSLAIESLDKALAIEPGFHPAKLAKGFCYHMLAQYDLAMATYNSIHADNPDPEARETVYNNYACVLMELGRQQEALQYLIDNCPGTERSGTLYNMSFLYLGLGEWPLGWQLYRQRDTVFVSEKDNLYLGAQAPNMPKVEQPIARSLPEIHQRHLLLFHEQGYGDTVQFMRYAKLLAPIADKITIGVPKALVRLVKAMTVEKPFEVICDNDAALPCDIALPMMDAPILFETTRDTVPNPGPYIVVPAAVRKAHYLPNISGNVRVGLCWAGATRLDNIRAHSIDRRRSLPFEYLEPLFALPEVDFYSLQLSDHHKDHPRLHRVLEDDFDMLDTAAIMTQMDLVITIDSSLCHVAGALGMPVWLLSRFDGCWRWGWNGETASPWYSTMRIFRQPAHNAWPAVVEAVRNELIEVLMLVH
jgi:tetratricopeptide (TPR) repeat protein